jgi:hypothetical protein
VSVSEASIERGESAVHGVVIDVTVIEGREDEAQGMLREAIVPRAKGHPGFAAGYWLRDLDGDILRSVHLYETEKDAQTAASEIAQGPPPGAPVVLRSVTVYEVIAQA